MATENSLGQSGHLKPHIPPAEAIPRVKPIVCEQCSRICLISGINSYIKDWRAGWTFGRPTDKPRQLGTRLDSLATGMGLEGGGYSYPRLGALGLARFLVARIFSDAAPASCELRFLRRLCGIFEWHPKFLPTIRALHESKRDPPTDQHTVRWSVYFGSVAKGGSRSGPGAGAGARGRSDGHRFRFFPRAMPSTKKKKAKREEHERGCIAGLMALHDSLLFSNSHVAVH